MCQQLNNLSISFCHRSGSWVPCFLRGGQRRQLLLLQLPMLPQTNIFLLVRQRSPEGDPQIQLGFPGAGQEWVEVFPYILRLGGHSLFFLRLVWRLAKKNFLIKVDCCMSICHLSNSTLQVFPSPPFLFFFAISLGNSSGPACASGACSLSLCFRFITYYFRFDTLAQGAWLLELNAVSPFEF